MSNRHGGSGAAEDEAQHDNSKDVSSNNKSSAASQKMAATGDVSTSSSSISTSKPPPASPAASPSMAQATASTPHLPPSSATSATTMPSTQSAGKLGKFLHAQKGNKASPQVMAMSTINSTASEDYVSDGLPSHPRPPHPMFHSLHEDSDGSDGSIVFNKKRKKTTKIQGNQEPVRGRERFPSFDSMASSGSLVRHGPQHSNNLPSPQAPKVVTQQNLAKVNPQMLPYDQRRKLMKMKQQQQQSQQRQQSPPRAPRRAAPPPPPAGRYMPPYMLPPPDFPQQNPYVVVNGMPMPAPSHPSQGFMYPMQPPHRQPPHRQPPHMQQHQQIPPNMPGPYGPFPGAPPPPNVRLSPYRSEVTPPRMDPNRLPAPQTAMRQGSGGKGRQYAPQQQPQHLPPNHPMHHQQQQQQSRPLPPSGVGRQQQQQQRDPRSAHPVSLGAVDQDPRALHSKNNSHFSIPTEPSQKDSTNSGPPPPPPPPLPPPHHVRTESTGSVSSLGSQGSIFGYIGGTKDEDVSRKQSFLQKLNPFSHKTQVQKSPRQTESDFRRQGQDFLLKQQTAMAGRPARQASPHRSHHQRVGSMDRPPASRGTHKRLPSIENDNWEEPIPANNYGIDRAISSDHSSRGHDSPSSHLSSREETDDDRAFGRGVNSGDANERTSLLSPPGQGSSEYLEHSRSNRYSESHRSNRRRQKQKSSRRNQRGHLSGSRQRENETTDPRMNTGGHSGIMDNSKENRRASQRKQKTKTSKRRRSRRTRNALLDDGSQSSTGSHHSSSSSSYDYRQWTRRRAQMLEDERTRLIAQWKAEARAEALNSHRQRETNQWHRRLAQYLDSELGEFWGKTVKFLTFLEAFICNLPLTVGAIAMALVTLGVCWFKFVEETLDTCEPVQFHSSQCTFPEFPGCFYCEDTTVPLYRWAVNFHFGCSFIAGVLALSFVLKMLLATQVVLDEMSSPTTASPAGLICMTSVCVFAGRGFLGQIIVSGAACVHLCLVIWFIYMALAYHIMPDPSWFPNTVGIGMSAVKIWLYYPMSGHFLMAISLSLNFFFFPISLIRVVMNEKISATVGYMQMSAPAISLYALTIMAQPSFEQEKPDINRFQRAHRLIYLPAMHFLFVLSVIGFIASVQSLVVRWKDFKKRDFSPAHAAFCFPTLSHANAIQAYRAAINSFSVVPLGSPWKTALDTYWLIVLVGGSIATLWISAKFFYNLPSWTNISVEGEEEPPAPYETSISLQNVIATGESLVQPFVSPAVLQANETGALVMVRRARGDTRQRFVRTRKLASLGFEPTMAWSEMEKERDLLLEWVGRNPPRRRNRTLSVPGIDFSYGTDFGVGNSGIYGMDPHVDVTQQPNIGVPPARGRAQTNSPYRGERSFF